MFHCTACGTEYAVGRETCGDCSGAVAAGPSPAFSGAAPVKVRRAALPADPTRLSGDDFVPLERIDDGWVADELCAILADAGIASMIVSARGRRMRAPGLEPHGPAPAQHEAVDVLVFPEQLDEARAVVLETRAAPDDPEAATPVPVDGPGTQCGVDCEHVAAEPVGSPVVALALGGVVVVIALAAILLWR